MHGGTGNHAGDEEPKGGAFGSGIEGLRRHEAEFHILEALNSAVQQLSDQGYALELAALVVEGDDLDGVFFRGFRATVNSPATTEDAARLLLWGAGAIAEELGANPDDDAS